MTEAESSSESPAAAVGFGPNAGGTFSQENYHDPAAGWGAAKSVSGVLLKQGEILDGTRVVLKMNHENGGFDCPGCAWPDDRKGLRLDICENGIKHSTWEMTRKRLTRDFFAAHTVTNLMRWSDFALEDAGRLTEPMRYDLASDKYVPVAWDEAFALAERHFRKLDSPDCADGAQPAQRLRPKRRAHICRWLDRSASVRSTALRPRVRSRTTSSDWSPCGPRRSRESAAFESSPKSSA